MKALVFNGEVVDVAEAPFEVHDSLTWVDCDNEVQIGWLYDGASFSVSPELDNSANGLDELRRVRNKRLSATDWWALTDRQITDEQIAYRQALRDITDTYSSLDDVVWPEKPE